MTSTTSSNNLAKEFKSIYRWSFKKRFGLTALFSGLMFMALPMILLLALNSASSSNAARQMQGSLAPLTDLNDVFQGCTQVVVPLLVVPLSLLFALILATMLYSYMHQKRSVDLFHAAPVGRTPLLLGKFVFGVTLLAIPLVLNFGVTAIVAVFYQLDPGQYLPYLLRTFAWVLFMAVASFAFATVMAVCSGTTFDMVISTVVINITYPLLIILSLVTAQRILPGMPLNISLGSVSTTALAPFVAAFVPVLPESAFSGLATPGVGFLLWWIFLTAALIAGAVYLYNNRKSECAESHFAFPLPKIFIRFIATGAAGLAFALVFLMVLDNDFSFFIGLLTGSLAAHIVAEAVYGRGFKGLKKSFAYYGVFLAAFAVFYGVLATGLFGYDTRVPAASEVTSVEVNTGGLLNDEYIYYNFNGFTITDENYNQVARVKSELKEPDSIEKAIAYHKGMVECYRATGYPYGISPNRGQETSLIYHLKNGRTMERKYSYGDLVQDLTDESLKSRQSELTLALVGTGEYKTGGNALYYLEPQFVKSITFYRNNSAENTVIVPDREATAELIDALRTDWENHQFSETWLDSDTTATEKADPNTYTNLNFDIQPARPNENGPLKAAVGDFDGKIRFDVGSYMLSEAFPNTKKLVEEKGWLK